MNQAPLSAHGPSLPSALETVEEQLRAYARDFREVVNANRDKEKQLKLANRQLQAYARDLKTEYATERRRSNELEQSYYDTVRRLVRASGYKDQETGKHIERLSHYSRLIAQHLGWAASATQLLFDAAPMHDVGKIGIPDAVMNKPSPLNEKETLIMRRHTILGGLLLKGSASPLLEMARQIALGHHERWDGTGYPRGLKGEKTPRAARIVMLVDQYDALRSPRPYKLALTHACACAIMLEGDGRTLPRHFEPELLDAFHTLHARFEEVYARMAD